MAKEAPAARALLTQASKIAPKRFTVSDGIIGDPAHRGRVSDHNPDQDGYCNAVDCTHDPAHGMDIHAEVREMVARDDKRIKYAISNRRIWSRKLRALGWRPYFGINPHKKHAHISIEQAYKFDTSSWFDKGDKVKPEYNPARTITDYVSSCEVPGGAVAVQEDGAIHTFGTARYHGGANGKAYFKNHKAARVRRATVKERLAGKVYVIVATNGDNFHFPETKKK